MHETGGSSGRENVTILACGSAISEKLPPYIVNEGKNLMTARTEGGPQDPRYSMSDSGWMEGANFIEWFRKVFLPAVKDIRRSGPVVLFLEGHAPITHYSWSGGRSTRPRYCPLHFPSTYNMHTCCSLLMLEC